MPVYNGAPYLRNSVDSILAQTFTDFEFIIINDGSTDDTPSIIDRYRDARIRVVTQPNHGLVYSLNRGMSLANGTYIARMDADDISMPQRLAKQIEMFAKDPSLVVVGTSIIRIDRGGGQLGAEYYLAHDVEIRQDLSIRCPFAHGSVMMRRNLVQLVGGYRHEFWPAEDYDLWRRMAAVGQFANSLEPLYLYRIHSRGISATEDSKQLDMARRISVEVRDAADGLQDISLRAVLTQYRSAPAQPRMSVVPQIIENYYKISVECGRRGKLVTAAYRLAKLASIGRTGIKFLAKKAAKKVGIIGTLDTRYEQA
jgi:glycosyltransferase involved in cell wall biosynthesis